MTNDFTAADVIVRYEEVPGMRDLLRIVFEEHDALSIPISVWADKSLRVGQSVEPALLHELERLALTATAKTRALRYLNLRPRTAQETYRYLIRAEFSAEVSRTVVTELQRAGFIDDRAYTEMFLRSKVQRSSRKEIAWKLKQRGIARETIDAEVWTPGSEDVEMQAALTAGWKHWQRHASDDARKRREKLAGFLARKGYAPSVVRRVVTEVSGSTMDENLP